MSAPVSLADPVPASTYPRTAWGGYDILRQETSGPCSRGGYGARPQLRAMSQGSVTTTFAGIASRALLKSSQQ